MGVVNCGISWETKSRGVCDCIDGIWTFIICSVSNPKMDSNRRNADTRGSMNNWLIKFQIAVGILHHVDINWLHDMIERIITQSQKSNNNKKSFYLLPSLLSMPRLRFDTWSFSVEFLDSVALIDVPLTVALTEDRLALETNEPTWWTLLEFVFLTVTSAAIVTASTMANTIITLVTDIFLRVIIHSDIKTIFEEDELSKLTFF